MLNDQETLDPVRVWKRGAVDRRATPRFPAFGSAVSIGWWEETRFRTVAGLLKDISRGGAAAYAEASPPPGTRVFIRLNGARLTEWLEASVIEVSKNRWFRRVPRLVRMEFTETCPYHFFQAAIDVLVMDCQPMPGDNATPRKQIASGANPRVCYGNHPKRGSHRRSSKGSA
jgi:hypothetical protein